MPHSKANKDFSLDNLNANDDIVVKFSAFFLYFTGKRMILRDTVKSHLCAGPRDQRKKAYKWKSLFKILKLNINFNESINKNVSKDYMLIQ